MSDNEQEDQELKVVKNIFQQTEIRAFPESLKDLIEVRSDATIIDAFSILVKSNIYAAPIRDMERLESTDLGEVYLGILSLTDFVAFILRVYANNPQWEKGMVSLLEDVATEKSHKNVMTLFSHENAAPFIPITIDSSVRAAFRLMGHHHVYRLMVVDQASTTRPLAILTQSALVRVLEEHVGTDYLKAIVAKTIQELGLADSKHQLLSVKASDPLIAAFEILQKNKVSGLPVCADDGTLVGNISIRDIREIIRIPHSFPLMIEPVSNFFEARKKFEGAQKHMEATEKLDNSIFPFPGCCTSQASLRAVIHHLVTFGMHRVFVVGADRHPIRVITLTDILDIFG